MYVYIYKCMYYVFIYIYLTEYVSKYIYTYMYVYIYIGNTRKEKDRRQRDHTQGVFIICKLSNWYDNIHGLIIPSY